MFNREIFRKTALDKLSTPDDLDELLQVNSKLSWLLLISLLCLVLCGIVWGIFGQVVNKVSMIGTIQTTNPPQSLIVSEPGLIDSVFHKPGDNVIKGQPIIRFIPDNVNNAKFILSPVDGELVELNIHKGGLISSAATIAKIRGFQKGKTFNPEFLFFVSEIMVNSLTIGQMVNVPVKGLKTESIRLSIPIKYIGKMPASDESINNTIPNKEDAARLKTGNYYLVSAEYESNSKESDAFKGLSEDNLYGKVLYGEVVISTQSPFSYLLSPSKKDN